MIVYINDADLEVLDTCVRNSVLSCNGLVACQFPSPSFGQFSLSYRSLFHVDLNSAGSSVSSVKDAAISISSTLIKLHYNQIILFCLRSAVLVKHRIVIKNNFLGRRELPNFWSRQNKL